MSEFTHVISLLPGHYALSGELPGFSVFEEAGIEIAAGETAAIDIKLSVSPVSESITVLEEEVTRVRDSVERLQDVPVSVSIVTGRELRGWKRPIFRP